MTLEKLAYLRSRPRAALRFTIPVTAIAMLLVLPGTAHPSGGGARKKVDTVPPTVAIAGVAQTAAPVLTVSGTASDNVGITGVDVKIDGGGYQPAQGTTSWSYAIDTSALAPGSHTVTARARDAAANSATASVIIGVSDATPPSVAISSPAANSTLTGTVALSGTAADNVQVAKVEVSIDGDAYRQVQGTTSWTYSLDTAAYANGSHTLRARATDTTGNVATVSESVVTGNDLAPPTISFSSPASGATLSGNVGLTGTAADDLSLAKVELSVDGGSFELAQGTTSWSYTLATTGYANGTHTLVARATDTAGKTTNATLTVAVDNSVPTGGGGQLVTPEGTTIVIAPDVTGWTPQQIYNLLKPNALELAKIGPALTVKVQTQYASQTTAGVTEVGGVYSNFTATIYLKATTDSSFTSVPESVLTHEYGHVWGLYHLWMTHAGNWTPYLVERGVAGDPRLDSSLNWSRNELLADDYRLLFGTQTAQNGESYINPYLPDPRTVPGLRDWLLSVWAGA